MDSDFSLAMQTARAVGDLGPLVATIPYAAFIGITAKLVDGDVVAELGGGQRTIGNPELPALHGGTIGALLESAALFKLMLEADVVELPKTVTITIDYLRSARPAPTFARAIIARQGRRVASVRVEAWQQDPSKPVAAAHAHFLLKTPSR